jgi:hypothetical protein
MGLRQDVPALIAAWKANEYKIQHNADLFQISEGNLLPLLMKDLKEQLNENSYQRIQHRIPPINVQNKIVKKLSTIYSTSPIRQIVGSKRKEDAKQLGELLKTMEFDTQMSQGNFLFNTFKSTWMEPYLHNGQPKLRAIPSDRFMVWSKDKVNPTDPTHFMKAMYKIDDAIVFYAYTKDEFLIFDENGKILDSEMQSVGNPSGVNEYKSLPGVYINRSQYCLIPPPDTDMLKMTKLIPILLADCNFAVMFQAFSIIYGIDVTDTNLKMAPNAFWSFKSDPNLETKPEIGVIKPEVDTDKVLTLLAAQISLWLESKGIKPGTIGTLNVQNAASGIAKIIDEADTVENRKDQVMIFRPKDSQLVEIIINNFMPIWKKRPGFKPPAVFYTETIRISTEFPEQRAMVDEGATTDTEIKKLDAGLTTRKRSLKVLNPDMTDEQIDELFNEIEAEQPAEPAVDPNATPPADPKAKPGKNKPPTVK